MTYSGRTYKEVQEELAANNVSGTIIRKAKPDSFGNMYEAINVSETTENNLPYKLGKQVGSDKEYFKHEFIPKEKEYIKETVLPVVKKEIKSFKPSPSKALIKSTTGINNPANRMVRENVPGEQGSTREYRLYNVVNKNKTIAMHPRINKHSISLNEPEDTVEQEGHTISSGVKMPRKKNLSGGMPYLKNSLGE